MVLYDEKRATGTLAGVLITFLVSDRHLFDQITDAEIEDQILGSDHCPVTLELNLAVRRPIMKFLFASDLHGSLARLQGHP